MSPSGPRAAQVHLLEGLVAEINLDASHRALHMISRIELLGEFQADERASESGSAGVIARAALWLAAPLDLSGHRPYIQLNPKGAQ